MSFDTDKNWMYTLSGRNIHLWQWVETAATDTVGSHRVKLPAEYYGKQLIYPNEDISSGLRIEYTAFSETFVSEALEDMTSRGSASNISFIAPVDIVSGTTNFWGTSSGFAAGDKIRVIGSASNDADYTIVSIAGTGNKTMEISESTITDESVGESITVYQIPKAVADASVDESSHVNLNRMLSLAVIDYIKAQMKEAVGDLQGKEYCMREFWKKVGDNESNKRNVSMSFPASPFAVK